MGASLSVHQQARHRSHDALCLLGYGGRGLIEHLTANELAYADDPEALRRDIVTLARQRHDDPLPTMPRGSSDFLVVVPIGDPVREALVEARSNLLAVAGFSTVIPGNAADVIAQIDVPVLLAHGDRDIGAPLHEVGSDFTACSDLTLIRLANSGHNHNVSPNRLLLWQRMVTWANSIAPTL
jgi:pimeloyl-ACP methyl ester carboxylesterase